MEQNDLDIFTNLYIPTHYFEGDGYYYIDNWSFKIPECSHGQSMRLKEKGRTKNGETGNLVLKLLDLGSNDNSIGIFIPKDLAIKGGIYEITYVGDTFNINIPANAKVGELLKIEGKGDINLDVPGNVHNDLYINIIYDELEDDEEYKDPLKEVKNWLENINDEDGNVIDLLNDLKEAEKNTDVHGFINTAESFFDYEFTEANKYAIIIMKYIEPHISTFEDLLRAASSITEQRYLNNKVWAEELYKKADALANSADSKRMLGLSMFDEHKDKEWGRRLFKEAENLADMNPNFHDYRNLADNIADGDYVNDKTWAKNVYQKTLDTNPSSSDYIHLCENISNDYYLNDKVWAKELIKKHIAFEDQVKYIDIIDLASMDDFLADLEFTKEVVSMAKEQAHGFDGYLELFNSMDNGSRATADMLMDILFDTIELLETDEQKEQLVDAIEYTINDSTVEIIKTKSIAELKEMYGKKGQSANDYGDDTELKLPSLDEMLGSDGDEPQHSLDECFDWIRKMQEDIFTLDNPIGEYENGDYETSLESVKDIMQQSQLHPETNAEYFSSFKKHIENVKGGVSNEELSLDTPADACYEELSLDIPTEPAPQPQPSDLKTQYANKIASGEIDPTEVSFADFEASQQNKEIDYKTVYSQMISESRIDPTETSYDEMVKVSKLFGGVDESEYKATYSKYIGSGDIDPAETTYDEIVNIANIFNEINAGITNSSSVTMDDIYQYLMKNVNDDNDYMVGDFLELKEGSGDSYDFASLAREMFDNEFNELDKTSFY